MSFCHSLPRSLWLLLVLFSVAPTLAQVVPDSELSVLERVEAEEDELRRLDQLRLEAVGEDVSFYRDLTRRQEELLYRELDALLAEIEDGTAAPGAGERAIAIIQEDQARVAELLQSVDARMLELRAKRSEASGDDVLGIELDMTSTRRDHDELFTDAIDHLDRLERLGVSEDEDIAAVEERLQREADLMAARVQAVMARQAEVDRRMRATPKDAAGALAAEQLALRERLAGTTASLDRLLTQMERREIDSSRYRQLLVEATGQFGAAVTDSKVAVGLVEDFYSNAKEWIVTQGPKWLVQGVIFVLILFGTWLLSRLVRRALSRALEGKDLERSQLLDKFVLSIVTKAILILGLLFALSQIGVEVGPALAGLGVAGFVVAFALQDSLSNFASGVMILMYQPFDVGDVIDAGSVSGTVDSMNLVSTTVLTFDNKKLVVPNNKIWGDVIQNVTAQKLRRVDLVFGIGYADDIPHAEEVLRDVVEQHELVLADPAPNIRLHELADSSVNFICRPWCHRDDYWTVYWDLTREVKLRFDAEGISIPFPQRDVHLYREGGATAPVSAGEIAPDSAAGDSPPPNDEGEETDSQ